MRATALKLGGAHHSRYCLSACRSRLHSTSASTISDTATRLLTLNPVRALAIINVR